MERKDTSMPRSTITAKGQTTVPKDIREHLGIGAGDEIEFVILENGTVMIEPAYVDITTLAGILHRKGRKAVSVEDMNKAIRLRARRSA